MNKKWLLIPAAVVAIVTVTVMLPSSLVAIWPASKDKHDSQNVVEIQQQKADVQVKVYLSYEKKVVPMSLEMYVRGVVAAEMPVTFEKAALEAQAIAARTYIVKRLLAGTKTTDGADVSDDHNEGQQYSTDAMLQKRWGMVDYAKNLSKINDAVNATAGQVALYNGKPIEALFFSTSSGQTENSEDYYGNELPYLRSVPSPWDLKSEKFLSTLKMPLSEFEQKLGVGAVLASSGSALIQPLAYSAADHILRLRVGDKEFSGKEFREKLGLRSTWFTCKAIGDTVEFITHGYGHDVGMSQYGANGMAQEGKSAADIIKHYYQGVSIGDVQKLLPEK
ncbi:MAG: stage II sporulation protein D [Tumebacillaceae bacterium]